MKTATNIGKYNRTALLLFAGTVIAALYWLAGSHLDGYNLSLGGAMFELLWCPALVALILVPAVSLFYWYKEGFKLTSWFFYIELLSLGVISTFIYLNI